MKQALQKGLIMSILGLIVLAKPLMAGGDVYRIFLNGKQVLEQYVYAAKPLDLAGLPLSEANSNDKLVAYYSHCGTIGKDRTITIRDEHGTVLKEWKFADAAAGAKDNGMEIPVKEILALQARGRGLSMYYSSQQLPAGRLLTKVGKAARPIV
ncbi:MAG: hypothetical protein JST68_09295 [Bacteroidetes bacterium]|nr:hypothetical protein [Bacteroidota bacterium]